MAENPRGQNKNGQQNSRNLASEENVSNRRNTSSRGMKDINLDRMRNDNRTPKSSGLSEKRNITGSDYDGQLSDE